MAPLEIAREKDEVQVQDDIDEEVEPVKVSADPRLPSAEEVETHRCDHIPYRSWCKWCVMGRGRGEQHRQAEAPTIPRVGIDYFYITRGGVKKRNELDYPSDPAGDAATLEARKNGEVVKCLLIRCMESKNIFAHCIPIKGSDEEKYAANLAADDVVWLGHTKVIIHSDNEPSLQTLITESLDALRVKTHNIDQIATEHPAAYDSQSNGGTEVGVKLVRGLFRTLKLCLESRIDKYVPINHALVPWLLQHTCMLLNARFRGTDGRTPWARARGRPFNQRLLGFGELVMYKLPGKGPRHQPNGNMGAQWK